MILDELKKHDKFVIFGAQVIAIGAYIAIKGLVGRTPECFVLGKADEKIKEGLNGNPGEIDGIEVKHIESFPSDMFIVVAVTELVQKEVLPFLKEKGYESFFALTQIEEYALMSQYYASINMFPTLEMFRGRPLAYSDWDRSVEAARDLDLHMYEVGNHRDNVLVTRPPLKEYEHRIQAGAALSDKRIADILDNTGCNISDKNKQYCEMTASYWIWKNKSHGWKGIEHYRRHLLVKPELLGDDIDAVLPLPYICYPNELYQFRRFISEDVKDALLIALKDVHPMQYEEYLKILQGHYQYTYNIVCAKNEVFDEYCKWFFEITEYMETMGEKVTDIRDTRALSYVAEVLTNLYFMSKKEELRIYHVQKEIYV